MDTRSTKFAYNFITYKGQTKQYTKQCFVLYTYIYLFLIYTILQFQTTIVRCRSKAITHFFNAKLLCYCQYIFFFFKFFNPTFTNTNSILKGVILPCFIHIIYIVFLMLSMHLNKLFSLLLLFFFLLSVIKKSITFVYHF